MIKYRIKNWAEAFEVAQSRQCAKIKWVPIPYNPSSYGFCSLMTRQDGAEIYGIFVMLVLEASQSRERGELTRGSDQKPHDPRSLSIKLRVPEKKLQNALQTLANGEVSWIEAEEISDDEQSDLDLDLPDSQSADSVQQSTPARGEETRGEEKRGEESTPDPSETGVWKSIESVMPAGWKKLSATAAKTARVKANTEMMVELGGLFNRRPTTLWTVAEAQALLAILPIDPDDLKAILSYYRVNMMQRDDIRRRDLITLLHNWAGEADRANRRKGPAKAPEKKSRPKPKDFGEFLEWFNPSIENDVVAWRKLETEYDNWKENNDA